MTRQGSAAVSLRGDSPVDQSSLINSNFIREELRRGVGSSQSLLCEGGFRALLVAGVSRLPFASFVLQALLLSVLLRRYRSPVGVRPAVWLRSLLPSWGGSSRAPTAVAVLVVASRASPSPPPLFVMPGGVLTRSRLGCGLLPGHAL